MMQIVLEDILDNQTEGNDEEDKLIDIVWFGPISESQRKKILKIQERSNSSSYKPEMLEFVKIFNPNLLIEEINCEEEYDDIIKDALLLQSGSSPLRSKQHLKKIQAIKETTTICQNILNSLKLTQKQFIKFGLENLYKTKIIFNYLNRTIKDPIIHAIEKDGSFIGTQEFTEYYSEYKKCRNLLYKYYDLATLEQRNRRGYIDSSIDDDIKIQILQNSIQIIRNKLDSYKPKNGYEEQFFFMLDHDPKEIHVKMQKSNLNYTNKEKTRYILFEMLMLAKFKIDTNKQTELWNEYKNEFIKEDLGKREKIRLFLNINQKNSLLYITTLYSEFFAYPYDNLREFLLFFFSEAAELNATNMLKDQKFGKEYDIKNGKIDRRYVLPMPPKEFNLIADCSV